MSLTLICIYFIGKFLGGIVVGLLASLIYCSNLFIAYWFNFTLADTAIHFHLSIYWFMLVNRCIANLQWWYQQGRGGVLDRIM